MKHAEYTENGIRTYVERYNNFNEFVSTCNKRSVVWTEGSSSARERHEPSFTRCDTFEEAQELLLKGFNESVPTMIEKVKGLSKGTRIKTQRYSDVVGYAPIVPNALLGLPNSMMNSKKAQVKAKVISIVYDPACPWYVEPEEVLEYGCKFINFVQNLERQGIRVRVDYAKCTSDTLNRRQYILRVPLKSEHNPINIKRMSFAMTHVGMQRFLGFDWCERVPNSEYISGYGKSLSVVAKDHKQYFESARKSLDENEYFVYYGMDLDTLFEGGGH